MKWRKTSPTNKPALNERVLIGNWQRYSNTRWKMIFDVSFRYKDETYNQISWASSDHHNESDSYPDYWLPIPDLPALSKTMLDEEKKGIEEFKNELLDSVKKDMKRTKEEVRSITRAKRRDE